MKLILKSYLKAYFKNWIEAFGLIIITIIIIAAISGTLSEIFQFNSKYDDLVKTSGKWDIEFKLNKSYHNGLLRNYYLNAKDNDGNTVINNEPLFKKDSVWWSKVAKLCNFDEDSIKKIVCESYAITNKLDEFEKNPFDVDKNIFNENAIEYLKDYGYSTKTEFIHWLLQKNKINNYDVFFNNRIYLQPLRGQKISYLFSPIEPKKYSPSKNVDNVNKLKLYDGRMPKVEDEVVINSRYAELNNIKVGDILKVDLIEQRLVLELKVVGIGLDLTNITKPFTNVNTKDFAIVYLHHDYMDLVRSFTYGLGSWTRSEIESVYIKSSKNPQTDFEELQNNISKGLALWQDSLRWYDSTDNAESIKKVKTQTFLLTMISCILLGLGFIFINYIIKKDMNRTSKQIGIFKAIGYQNKIISSIFTIKLVITIMLSICLGYLFGIPLQIFFNKFYMNTFLIPLKSAEITWMFGIIFFIVIPCLFGLVSYILNLIYLNKPLIYLTSRAPSIKFIKTKFAIKKMFEKTNFIFRLQVSFTLHSLGKWIAVMIIFFVTSFLFILQSNINKITKDSIKNVSAGFKQDVNHLIGLTGNFMLSRSELDSNSNLKKLRLVKNNDLSFIDINEKGVKEEINQKNQIFKQQVLIPAQSISDKKACIDTWSYIMKFKPYHMTVKLTDLQDYMKILENSCYDEVNNKSLLTEHNLIPKWVTDLVNESYKLSDNNAFASFNQLYYDSHSDTPIIHMQGSIITNSKITNAIRLYAPKKEDYYKFFNTDNLTSDQINSIFDNDKVEVNEFNLPIVDSFVSEKLIEDLDLKVGDTIPMSLLHKYAANGYTLQIRIKGIIRDEIYENSIYTNWAKIVNLYVDKFNKPISSLYNMMVSKSELIDGKVTVEDILENNYDYKYNLRNIPIVFEDITNTKKNIAQIIESTDNGRIELTPIIKTNSTNDIRLIQLYRLIYLNQMKLLLDSFLIFQILTLVAICLILVVITSSIIEESSNIILMLRAIGYKSKSVNYIIIGNYIIGILIFYVLAYFSTIAMWYLLGDFNFKLIQVRIYVPWDWVAPVQIGAIILGILTISWLLAMWLVKKKKLSQIND